jgi:hypothetical protein
VYFSVKFILSSLLIHVRVGRKHKKFKTKLGAFESKWLKKIFMEIKLIEEKKIRHEKIINCFICERGWLNGGHFVVMT